MQKKENAMTVVNLHVLRLPRFLVEDDDCVTVDVVGDGDGDEDGDDDGVFDR